MPNQLGLICLGVLLCHSALAKEPVAPQQHNLAATRHYYAQLLAGDSPQLAELTLFTTLLPKGGDLHHHYSGAIYAETYLDWVGAQNYCVYRVTNVPLKTVQYQIETRPQSLSAEARALCLSADAVHQDDDFYRGLLMHWSDKDFDNHSHEQPVPDQQFFATFGYFGAVSGYAYNDGLRALKARALAENVSYLETMLKSGPAIDAPALNASLNALNANTPAVQVEASLAQALAWLSQDEATQGKIDQYLQSLQDAAAGIDDARFKLRFQAYVSRNSPPARVFSSLYTSFVAAQRGPLVVGVNIVGPENGYVAMRDYSLHMQMFAFLKQRFPNVKLSLHAGELVLGMVPPEGLRSHIHDAVLVAGANRIGHGVDIAHETNALALLQTMRQRQVAVEVNLTSNAFILGVKNEAHPVKLYARYGVPFVISTDDAGVSRNNLSGEYLLYVSRYKPSYDQLKQVVYNSIRYSFLNAADQRDATRLLDQRFAEFEAQIAQLPLHNSR